MNSQIYVLTKRAIDRADPIHLLKIGAPDDEYELEIREIVSRVGECMNLEDMQRLLHEVFTKWFDERIAGSKELYRAPAEVIWNRLPRVHPGKVSDEPSV
ncbi:MAG: hypothetical protein ACRERE_03270 [Candidatus Entotheonellia bacterium]